MNRLAMAAALAAGLGVAAPALAQINNSLQTLQSGGVQTPYIQSPQPAAPSVQAPAAAAPFASPVPAPAPVFQQPGATLLQNGTTPGVTAPLGAPGTITPGAPTTLAPTTVAPNTAAPGTTR